MLFLPSIRGTLFQVPYPVSSVFAAITKSAGVCTNNSHSGTSSPSMLRTCRGATQASRIIAEQHWEDRKTQKPFRVESGVQKGEYVRYIEERQSGLENFFSYYSTVIFMPAIPVIPTAMMLI